MKSGEGHGHRWVWGKVEERSKNEHGRVRVNISHQFGEGCLNVGSLSQPLGFQAIAHKLL